jgi:hypothetical protein
MRKGRVFRNIILSLAAAVVMIAALAFCTVRYNPSFVVRLLLRRNTSSWQVDFDDITYVDGREYRVDGVRLSYDGKELLTVNEANVKLRMSEVVSFIRVKGSSVEITADECTFDLTGIVEAYNSTDKSSPDKGFSLYEFVTERNFSAYVDSVHISSEEIWGDIKNLDASYSSEETELHSDFSLESAHFNYTSYQGTVTGGEITLVINDDIWIDGEVNGVDLYTYGIREVLTDVTLSGSTDSVSDFFAADFRGSTVVEKGTITYESYRFELGEGEYSYMEKSLSGSLDSFTAYYDSLVLGVTSPVFSLSYTGDFEVSATSSSAGRNGLEFNVTEPVLSGSLMNLSASFSSPLISSELGELTNGLFESTELTDVKADLTVGDRVSVTASFDGSVTPLTDKLDEITFSSVLDYSLSAEDSGFFTIDIYNITPGFEVSSPLSLAVSGNTESAEINGDGDKLKLKSTISLENCTLEGHMELDELTLKNVLELILDKELKYLSKNTLVSLSADYDIGWGNDEGKLLGTADWECSFDYSWKSLFTVLLSSSSSLVFKGDTVDVNNLLITTPFFTLKGDGYYDLVTGTPHIEFN